MDLIHHGGEGLDLAEGLELGHGYLDVVEQIVEHRVFRAQDIRDFHY